MASGQQIAEENVRKFVTWAASKTDEDFRNIAVRGFLSRTEIAAECGFAKSALAQNPRIRDALKTLETSLRQRGVLPSLAPDSETDPSVPRVRQADLEHQVRDAERLSRLERENASLRAENSELKRLLARYAVLQQVLAETGRLPR
jgi:hypothetical protein